MNRRRRWRTWPVLEGGAGPPAAPARRRSNQTVRRRAGSAVPPGCRPRIRSGGRSRGDYREKEEKEEERKSKNRSQKLEGRRRKLGGRRKESRLQRPEVIQPCFSASAAASVRD